MRIILIREITNAIAATISALFVSILDDLESSDDVDDADDYADTIFCIALTLAWSDLIIAVFSVAWIGTQTAVP